MPAKALRGHQGLASTNRPEAESAELVFPWQGSTYEEFWRSGAVCNAG